MLVNLVNSWLYFLIVTTRVILLGDLYCCLLPQCEALRTCRSGFPIATTVTLNLNPKCKSKSFRNKLFQVNKNQSHEKCNLYFPSKSRNDENQTDNHLHSSHRHFPSTMLMVPYISEGFHELYFPILSKTADMSFNPLGLWQPLYRLI